MTEQTIDYRDWVYRFLTVYRFPNRSEVTNVPQAIKYLEEQQYSQEKLDKIWRDHVERNLYRDKLIRNKKSITRDTANIFKYLKEEHYGNPIPSVIEALANNIQDSIKCHCGKEEFRHMQNHEHLCSWHFSEKWYSEGPTGLNALRSAYKNRIPQKPGETLLGYLKRALKTGSERMHAAKVNKRFNDDEARKEREAIQQEGTVVEDSGTGTGSRFTFKDLERPEDFNLST